MAFEHPRFWPDLAAKVGAPIFAATLVACLLSGDFDLIHGILMGAGLLLIGVGHWRIHHVVR
jgi:hypothetical protein